MKLKELPSECLFVFKEDIDHYLTKKGGCAVVVYMIPQGFKFVEREFCAFDENGKVKMKNLFICPASSKGVGYHSYELSWGDKEIIPLYH